MCSTMMVVQLLLTAVWAIPRRFTTSAFIPQKGFLPYQKQRVLQTRAFLTSSSLSLETCLSRLDTLQTLLQKYGAPGSQDCRKPGDLKPVSSLHEQDMPELLSALTGGASASLAADNDATEGSDLTNLHPYLFPIAQSTSQPDAFICAYRNPSTEESNKNFPWPIVETKLGGPGFRLLALNSEHLMRRIACERDDAMQGEDESIEIYNSGLGMGKISDASLDAPYTPGAVAQLGYGLDKYILLRVGPFPDLYDAMSQQHREKGDEQSSLIAAEASNKKFAGFGSTFLHYAQVLASFPNRAEESRDAARMCLRLPLPSIGLSYDDYKSVAILGQIADESDPEDVVLEKLSEFQDKMREVEQDQEQDQQSGRTAEQAAFEEATAILDKAALTKKSWTSVRTSVGEKLRAVERNEFAQFVDYKPS